MSIQFRWSTTDRAMGAPAAVPTPGRRVAASTISWTDLFDAPSAASSVAPAVESAVTSSRVAKLTSRVARFSSQVAEVTLDAFDGGLTEPRISRPKNLKAGDQMNSEPEQDPNALEGVDFVEWLLEH